MPIRKVEINVPTVAKLRILFAEDFISLNLTCNEPAKSKKLKSIPKINLGKSITDNPCFIDSVKSTDSWAARIAPAETIVPISMNPIPDGNLKNFTLMYEKIAASEINIENSSNICIEIDL